MRNMTLRRIAEAVKGILHTEGMPSNIDVDTTEAAGVVLDSRKVESGYIFIATRGEHVDGHSYIEQIFDIGALGVICERAPENPKGAYILVEDSFRALEDVAEYYRKQLAVKVVGITGSVGKTSTKEFVASVLSKGFRVQKTEGNFNNEIGLPLTVLQIRSDCEIAVLEMGISDFGEMHRLSRVAKPNVCLITNIGQCHLEHLGTRDGILKAKSEIFDYIQEGGQICLNGDDDKLITIKRVKGITPVFFGSENNCVVYANNYQDRGLIGSSAQIHIGKQLTHDGTAQNFDVEIPLPGEHMLYNALAAVTVGALLGLSAAQIQAGIKDVKAVEGRSHVICTDRFTLIDDCYNANPVSVKAALALLNRTNVSDVPNGRAGAVRQEDVRKVAILGDMFELGANEAALHCEVGVYAVQKGIDVIVCVGKLCKNMYDGAKSVENASVKIYYYEDKAALFADIKGILHDGDIVLVKASHGMHFEEIIAGLSIE